MSAKDVMMIQDTVRNYALAAGGGDFSRTAFEYGRDFTLAADKSGKSHCMLKTIFPETGYFKISFDYKVVFSMKPPDLFDAELFYMRNPYNPSYDIETRMSLTTKQANRFDIYRDITLGTLVPYIKNDALTPDVRIVVSYEKTYTPNFKNAEYYLFATKGDLFYYAIKLFVIDPSDIVATFRNIKITY